MADQASDSPILDLLASMNRAGIEASTLDAQTLMLVRLAALVAVDAPPVSYVLNHAGLLDAARDSADLMRFGRRGAGRGITVYAHGAHAYMVIAGLRFDTSGRGEEGPRWRLERRSAAGYAVRHPAGL